MRRITIAALFVFLSSFSLLAQKDLKSADDFGRISLMPMIASNSDIPSFAAPHIRNKLVQIVTQNGLSGESLDKRFIITANLVEISKDITATTPSMVAIGVIPTFYIGDLETGELFASCTLPIAKGVGTNENKAYVSAVNSIKLNDSSITAFVESGKNKIIEYYNLQIDFILSKAESLAIQERYDESIALLYSVPNACKGAYERAMNMTAFVFQRKLDKDGAVLLNTARQVWNADQSYVGAEKAGVFLSQINPKSSSFGGAAELSGEIARRIKEIDKREWVFQLKQHNDEMQLVRQAIEAAKAIGEAQAKQSLTYNTRVYWW